MTSAVLLQGYSDMELCCFTCCYPEEDFGQTTTLPVIRDAKMLMWTQYYGFVIVD